MAARVSGWSPVTSRARAPDLRAARFELSGKLKTDVKEASDVVALPGGRFLIVGDRSDRVMLMDANGKKKELKLPALPNGNSQLEGVAYDPIRHHLFVAREEKGELLRYEWNALKDGPPRLEKVFDVKEKGPKNKGVEGMAYLPGDLSPTGRPQLLLAKEGKPRELWVHDDGGGGTALEVKLEKEVLDACRDFSALAVDPKTGHVFISSDESSTCVQVKLVRDGNKLRGSLVQAFPLRDEKGKALERVEGLTFNAKGDLFVLTENDGALRQLARRTN